MVFRDQAGGCMDTVMLCQRMSPVCSAVGREASLGQELTPLTHRKPFLRNTDDGWQGVPVTEEALSSHQLRRTSQNLFHGLDGPPYLNTPQHYEAAHGTLLSLPPYPKGVRNEIKQNTLSATGDPKLRGTSHTQNERIMP